jgi:hypothetical protein
MALYGKYGAIGAADPANLAAYAIEQSMQADWVNTLARMHPMLAMLAPRINKGIKVSGRKLICPVIANDDDVNFEGVADADQNTAMADVLTTGDTQAEYDIAHYRGKHMLTGTEIQLLSGPAGTARGNILNSKKVKVEEKLKRLLATNTSGTGVGSRTAHAGLLNLVSSSNVTVGGIAQADLATWIPMRDTSGGTLGLERVDGLWDQVSDGSGIHPIDLIVCSMYSGGPNLWNSFRQLIAANDDGVVVDKNWEAKYGFRNFIYAGAKVVGDSKINGAAGAGRVLGLASGSFFAASSGGGKNKLSPQAHAPMRKPGTDSVEYFYTLFFGMGCSNPRNNFHMSALDS